MKKVEFKKGRFNPALIFLLVGLVISCTSATQLTTTQPSQKGWNVLANAEKEILTIEHRDLGVVVRDAHLNLRKDGELSKLSGWTVEQAKDKLIITTRQPESTTWEFKITEKGVDVSCSAVNGVITGIAPASEERIPARVESQDNGVMYTALGFVSAKNIYSLFDRETDILIQFSKESDLRRNASNERLMDLNIPLVNGMEVSFIPDYYTEEIGLAHYYAPTRHRSYYSEENMSKVTGLEYYTPMPKRFKTAGTGWCSWYCYGMGATEEDMVEETNALAKDLKPYGLEYVQLDACFTKGKDANWLEWTKETYPRGGKWLMQYIKSKGLKPGLWVNIYGANYEKPAFGDKYPGGRYPENFYLHGERGVSFLTPFNYQRRSYGNLFSACCTADSTVVRLDYTNPEVIENHLKPLFKTLVEDWGMEYLKSAGGGSWMDTYEENRERVYDPSIGSRQIYREAQAVVRDIMGPNNYINGCAKHEYGIGFGLFEGARTGQDDSAEWVRVGRPTGGIHAYFRAVFASQFLNGIVWWSDPDVVMVRDPLTLDEGMTIVSTIALSGQLYLGSDWMADFSKERLQRVEARRRRYPHLVKKLSEEKLELYKRTMPAMPIIAMDLYPFRTEPLHRDFSPNLMDYPNALDLKVNATSGVYDVVAVYNWSDTVASKTVSFGEDLGLDTEKKYLIFDFWSQELLGIFKDKIQVSVPIHGTRALVIRPLSDRPQLLATSRHISGAFSIKDLAWDSSKFALSGTSQTVPDAPYSLFIYIPPGVTLSKVDANALNLSYNITTNRMLEVSFKGQEEPVDWVVEFKK
jgi:hypothetical protein